MTETRLTMLVTLRLGVAGVGRRGEEVKEEGEVVDDIAGKLIWLDTMKNSRP